MKRTMRTLVFALFALAITLPVAAQEMRQVTGIPKNETKAERKAREKKIEELRDSIAFVEAKMAIDSSYFVVTADRIMLDNRVNVMAPESSTNFILIQGDNAIVQLALAKAHPGLNGLGGITVNGTIGSRSLKTTKKGDIYYTFNVTGTGISAQITITVYKNSNQAMVYVSPNFNSNTLTVYGPLIPYDHYGTRDNKVFKGRSIP